MLQKQKKGFTLIELLVVIAIIGILSSVVLASLTSARTKAKIARVNHDLREFSILIAFLEDDTGETSGHYPIPGTTCPTSSGDNDFFLNLDRAGLQSTDGLFTNWKGPYIRVVPPDPWGKGYIFDDDYDCSPFPEVCGGVTGDVRAIHSGGPNSSDENDYDADNIVRVLCRH